MPYYPAEAIDPPTISSGTFTPAIKFGGASVGVTYSVQVGKYTKDGNIVAFSIDIVLTSKGSSVGAVTITGLPFAGIAGMTQSPNVGFATGIVTSTSIGAWIQAAATLIDLQNANVNYSAALTDANVSNTTILRITGPYLSA